jgi:hypothetical protein
MTPSNVLGVLLALASIAAFLMALIAFGANAHGSVTAPGSESLTGTVILGLASLGFAVASWWSFTN